MTLKQGDWLRAASNGIDKSDVWLRPDCKQTNHAHVGWGRGGVPGGQSSMSTGPEQGMSLASLRNRRKLVQAQHVPTGMRYEMKQDAGSRYLDWSDRGLGWPHSQECLRSPVSSSIGLLPDLLWVPSSPCESSLASKWNVLKVLCLVDRCLSWQVTSCLVDRCLPYPHSPSSSPSSLVLRQPTQAWTHLSLRWVCIFTN